jgi:3-oxoacyl-[acyl-carrier protein] reductase
MRFKDKTALVTGAARGIGAAISQRLASEGAQVFAVDRTAFTAPAVEGGPGRIVAVQTELAERDASASLLQVLDGQALDYLVNNAGIGGSRPLWETTDEDWDRYLDINLRSVFRLSRDLLPSMTRPGACIVNMSSIFGLVGRPGNLAYAVSKAGIAQLTVQLAADLGPRGIRVNAVAPGVIDTALTHQRIHEDKWYQQFMCDAIALRRNGTPEDISGVVAFLCSDDARYMTGQVLVVDGGWLTSRYLAPIGD